MPDPRGLSQAQLKLQEKARRQAAQAAVRVPARLVSGLAFLVLLGTFLLMLPPMGREDPLKLNEALFTAVSALTVTGLSIITPYQDLTGPGKIVLLLLIQLGGVGYMALAITVFRILGRQVTHTDRLALCDSLGLVSTGGIMRLFWNILLTVTCIEMVGAVLLWWHWRSILPPHDAAFYGLFHAVSAFCNCGFDLFAGRAGFETGIPTDTFTLVVLAVLIFLGSVGFPVLYDLLNWPARRSFTLHTRITLPLVLFLVFGGGLTLLFSEGPSGGILNSEPLSRRLIISVFQSVSARTAGFTAIPDLSQIAPASKLVLMMLMFIGASPASMGGGITTGTFATLILALWAHVKGLDTPIVGGRALPGEQIRRAGAVLTVCLSLVLLSSWAILVTHNLSLDKAVFEVISAFATCGLSLGATPQMNIFGQVVLMVVMFWGRLGALTIVVALARPRPKRLVTYPEERILIG
ncbi:MAG: potassium transporter [Armatimonadota bacterium]|nr:MAG: potassium transporter [Armatimonadota bacterium]